MNKYEKTVEAWRARDIRTDAELAEALNGQSVLFAYHSGRIENERITFHDTREIFDHDGVTAYTGDLRTLFEIRNARDAHELYLEAFAERRPLDQTLILDFHRCLTQNTYDSRRYRLGERPGEYKHHDFVTGRNEIGAAPEDVTEEMAELLEELAEIEEGHILKAAAYFHVKFENIHPFADGNGRTGRLAMNYLFVTHRHPPVTIHEEDRKTYFSALEAWDMRQDLEPMAVLLREQTVKTWTRRQK